MATIALYAGRINQVSGQVSGAKKAVGSLKTQLDTLKKKCEKVNASVCNIDDVIRSISASTRTQEAKAEMLETLAEDIEQFVDYTVDTDDKVADKIESNKDDFYDKYSYLKPDCEKSGWEKFKKGLKKIGEWCKEHWASIVTILVVIAVTVAIIAASIVTFGAATVILAAVVGAIVGLVGQLLGDVIGFIKTKKWDSTLADYIGALFGGAIGLVVSLSLGPVIGSGVDSMLSSLLSDSLNGLFGGEKKSLEEIWLDATVEGLVSMVFTKMLEPVSDWVSKFLSGKVAVLSRLAGKGSYDSAFKMVLTKLSNGTYGKFTIKSIGNGVISNLNSDFFKNILDGFGVQDFFENGDIVVAIQCGNGDGFIKRAFLRKDKLSLESFNPNYPVMTFTGPDIESIKIIGVVKKIIKSV